MKNNRFQYWIWFGLILTSLPIILTLWKLRGVAPPNEALTTTFKTVVSRGELLLICLSFLGANLGDLFKEECEKGWLSLMLKSITFILSLFAIYSFGEINTNIAFNKDFAFSTSITIFICSILICVVSILTPRKTN